MKLTVGIPREVKPLEKRVGLTPEGVKVLVSQGIAVLIEKSAGQASGFSDETYAAAGARIVNGPREVYEGARLIQKIKEPQPSEYSFFNQQHILFSYLHLAAPDQCHLVKALMHSKGTAIGFETVERGGRFPLLKPMSEIAGGLAASFAALFVSRFKRPYKIENSADLLGDLERAAAGYPDPPSGLTLPGVLIWGGGVAGEHALELCLRMNAKVTMVESNSDRAAALGKRWKLYGHLEIYSPESLPARCLETSSVWIGCVHSAGRRAFRVLSEDVMARVSAGSKIIIDIAIDQGGNFPGALPMTYEAPLSLDAWGNLRFSVTNMPSLCGPEASRALTEATLTYTSAMAADFEAALAQYPELAAVVNIRGGHVRLRAVCEAHQLPYQQD